MCREDDVREVRASVLVILPSVARAGGRLRWVCTCGIDLTGSILRGAMSRRGFGRVRFSSGRRGAGGASGGCAVLLFGLVVVVGTFRLACGGSSSSTNLQPSQPVDTTPTYAAPTTPLTIAAPTPREEILPTENAQCGDSGICKAPTIKEKDRKILLDALVDLRAIQKDWQEPRKLPWKSGCGRWASKSDIQADNVLHDIKPLRGDVVGVSSVKSAVDYAKSCADCDPDIDSCKALPKAIVHAEAEVLGAKTVK